MAATGAPPDHHGRGIIYMLLATILFSAADALAKLLTENYPFMQIVWLRSLFGIALVGGVIIWRRQTSLLHSKRPGWQFIRSLAGIMLTCGILTGLKYIPLAEVTAIVFATPLIVALYSSFVLGETVNRGIYLAIVTGFVGVLFVVRPSPDHFHAAHLLMLGFACASAFLSISARKLAATEHILTLNFYIYPASVVFSTWWALDEWQSPDLQGWLLFFLVSLLATMALYCVTKAMLNARPSQVAPFDYARILWTVSIGYLFWGEFPDQLTWLGILVIISSGLYIVTRPRKPV